MVEVELGKHSGDREVEAENWIETDCKELSSNLVFCNAQDGQDIVSFFGCPLDCNFNGPKSFGVSFSFRQIVHKISLKRKKGSFVQRDMLVNKWVIHMKEKV